MKPLFSSVSLFFIFILAFSVDSYNEAFLARHGVSALERDVFYKALGEFKDTASDISYVKADIYYHGGIYDLDEHEEGHDHGSIASPAADKEHHEKKVEPSLNILPDVGNAIHITEHRHLSGSEEKEILPWIYYSVRLNPHNETAYAVGGYWLAVQLKKPDEAVAFLKKGLVNNPRSWEICRMLGQIFLLQKKNYAKARYFLEKAEVLVEAENTDKFDKRGVYGLLAETYLRLNKSEKARAVYEKELNLFPGDKATSEKISGL